MKTQTVVVTDEMVREATELTNAFKGMLRKSSATTKKLAALNAALEPSYPFGKMVRGSISGDIAMCIGTEPDGDITIIPVTGERAGSVQCVPSKRWNPVT